VGGFKEKNREGISQLRESGREAADCGSEMNRQAEEINALLESIELQDEDDIRAVSETGRGYQSSFNEAFSEQVEQSAQQIEAGSEQIREEAGYEMQAVEGGIHQLEQAGGISEIGREAAEGGKDALERSADEYGAILSEAKDTAEEVREQVDQLQGDLSRIFG